MNEVLIEQCRSTVSFAPNRIYRKVAMANIDEAREAAQAIASGLKQLGPDRKVALSTHKTKALIVALEKKAAKLVAALDGE